MNVEGHVAVYPGSFDPITNGHIDIISRASAIFDRVVVAVLENPNKKTLFSADERVEILNASLKNMPNVEVRCFNGLLVDFLASLGARVIIRGLRFVSDYEYELQMALMNSSLKAGIETFFLVARPERTFVSSSLVKEIARFGHDVSAYVPPNVVQALKSKVGGE